MNEPNHPVKMLFRCFFSAVIIAGFALGAWWAAAVVTLTHDSDTPGSFHDRLYPWDVYAAGVTVVAISLFAGVRAFLRPQRTFATWSMFIVATVLLIFLGSILVLC